MSKSSEFNRSKLIKKSRFNSNIGKVIKKVAKFDKTRLAKSEDVELPNKPVSDSAIEKWINTTLEGAECLTMLHPETKSPLARFEIDKSSLSKDGLNKELIFRVYRALYVYSMGYNALMQSVVNSSK